MLKRMVTRTIVFLGLLLGSAEAWASQETVFPSDGDGTIHRVPEQLQPASRYRALQPWTQPNNLEERLRSTQGKGPVDVISISFTAALVFFFLIVARRRIKARRDASPPDVELPSARVLRSSGQSESRDRNSES
jgi:hypothetical protein